MRIVAVTACPTGVALTYMAATRLANAARAAGHAIKIETQGALGIENVLAPKDVAKAEVVVLAADIDVRGAERFVRCLVLRVSTAEAIEAPEAVFARAAALIVAGGGIPEPPATEGNV